MKRFLGYALIAGLLSVPAFAAKNSQTVSLTGTTKVGTTTLPAGDYKVTWTGTGSNVQVTIGQNGKTAVTVPAKLVDAKNGHVAVMTNQVGGVDVLESIELNKLNLVLTGATTQGE
jgi:hypothetical protein